MSTRESAEVRVSPCRARVLSAAGAGRGAAAAGGTCLAATTSGSGITTSERRVRMVQPSSVHAASSPRASVSPPSIRYLTTTRVPGLGGGQELLGRRLRGTHPSILGRLDSGVRTRVTPG